MAGYLITCFQPKRGGYSGISTWDRWPWIRTTMRRLLTSVDSVAKIHNLDGVKLSGIIGVPSHFETEYIVRGRGLCRASRRIREAIW
jgi:hypothetical protein